MEPSLLRARACEKPPRRSAEPLAVPPQPNRRSLRRFPEFALFCFRKVCRLFGS